MSDAACHATVLRAAPDNIAAMIVLVKVACKQNDPARAKAALAKLPHARADKLRGFCSRLGVSVD